MDLTRLPQLHLILSHLRLLPFNFLIDVGQADAALLTCEGHTVLIDGGNKDDSSLLYTLLQTQGTDHLDLVIGTHADEDHIGGLPGAFYYADADLTLCSTDHYDSDAFSDFKNYAELRGGGIQIPDIGDIFSFGSADLEILAVNCDSASNDSSIVAKVTHGANSLSSLCQSDFLCKQRNQFHYFKLSNQCKLTTLVNLH